MSAYGKLRIFLGSGRSQKIKSRLEFAQSGHSGVFMNAWIRPDSSPEKLFFTKNADRFMRFNPVTRALYSSILQKHFRLNKP